MAKTQKIRAERPYLSALWKATKILLALALIAFVALCVAVGIAYSELGNYNSLKANKAGQQSITVRAADGSVLISVGPMPGKWINYDDIPPVMVDAMLSVEDRRFDYHPGVDPIGIARSLKVRLQKGHWAQGGSTITQQLARNLFLNNSQTFPRKAKEAILALALERKFSKKQIVELYLNKVYFGGGAYGIDAASRLFFGHSATELSLGEAAIIAGLVKAPSNYSPTADAKAAIDRSRVVLQLMVENGKISAAQAAGVVPASVALAPQPKQNSVRYFTDWALPQLDMLIDETNSNIEVWTTLDRDMQNAATTAITNNAPKGSQGALVSLDRDGAVRAMVGGTDYVTSNYNRATQAVRQPGSAFKLFVYLAALEDGLTPDDMVVDEPVNINGWQPRNSSGRFSGSMSVRTAFSYSVNTIAAKLGQEVGTSTVASMARRFGITTPINTQPAMVLGSSNVRLIDMTRAFASVSAQGRAVTPYGIAKVTTDDGKILFQQKNAVGRALVAPYVASEMTDLLQSAVATGSGKAAQIGRPVAGKTGTTTSNKDGWFIGFSSGLTTGVWMGHDDARPVGGLQGGTAPAKAFSSFMRVAVADRPAEKFQTNLTPPDWALEETQNGYFGEPDAGVFVDENGNPVDPGLQQPSEPVIDDGTTEGPVLNQEWIDGVIGRKPAEPAQPKPEAPPVDRPPQPPSGQSNRPTP